MRRGAVRDLLRRPLVVAPMAGGPSTPALVLAATAAGALGMLAGGYKAPEALAAEIDAVRAETSEAFGVNLFVPGRPTEDPEALERYLSSLAADAEAVGARLGDPVWDDDAFAEKLAVVHGAAPAIVTFTFGCPEWDVVSALHGAGSVVAVTVTSADEALLAAAAGADALCVQGVEAGAHRGTFVDDDRAGRDMGLLALMGDVARVTDLPQLAAGGIVTDAQLRGVLAAGAVAAQCGTAFLRCPESGAAQAHKDALADHRSSATVVTRAFSGRPARGIENDFVRRHAGAPAAYPEIHHATRPMRAAAAEAGDTGRMSLWAGQGFRAATDRAAGDVVEMLCRGS